MKTQGGSVSALRAISLWCSYVRRGAPTNAAGARVGYGRTKAEASAAASHWANQAPWERFQSVRICDRREPGLMTEESERIAFRVCGMPGEFLAATAGELRRAKLIEAGRYASAVIDFFEETDAGKDVQS